ncbi:hypothetical protein BZA77DRAFT_169486 [Pyronema omphalodes]|nr:hypothetical protein BZA77DRAFT_169486 [Pyronema omphalodes]
MFRNMFVKGLNSSFPLFSPNISPAHDLSTPSPLELGRARTLCRATGVLYICVHSFYLAIVEVEKCVAGLFLVFCSRWTMGEKHTGGRYMMTSVIVSGPSMGVMYGPLISVIEFRIARG